MKTISLFVVLVFSLNSLIAAACIKESAPLLRDGKPLAGLDYVAVMNDTTTFRAGTGKNAVTFSLTPEYSSDSSSGDAGNETDQDKRFSQTNVCLSIENACGGTEKESPTQQLQVCFKRDALWSDASKKQNMARLTKVAQACPKILDMVSFGPAGKVKIKAADKSGKNVANVELELSDTVTADFRKGSYANTVLDTYSMYKGCLAAKLSKQCERYSNAQLKKRMEALQPEFDKYKSIENRLVHYSLTFTPSQAGGNGIDPGQKTSVKIASSYYQVGENESMSGTDIEPVEKVAGTYDLPDERIAVFHNAEVLAYGKKDEKPVSNMVEFLEKSYEQYRSIDMPADHKGFDVGVASSPLVSEGCQLIGGAPKHGRGIAGAGRADKAELVAPADSAK